MDDQFVPLSTYCRYPVDEMKRRARDFYDELRRRRTVRHFSEQSVPQDVIEDCLRAAGTAPSGANMQPWHFAVVTDPAVKEQIAEAAHEQERAFYGGRASQEWLDALRPLGTNEHKPFLQTAPCLIAIFAQRHGLTPEGEPVQHYYVSTSVGIATGMLIAALHHAGLATLTYTPSPMRFLNDILDRPENERAIMVLVTGYPASDVKVPAIGKKALSEIATFY